MSDKAFTILLYTLGVLGFIIAVGTVLAVGLGWLGMILGA